MQVTYTVQPADFEALAAQARNSSRNRFIPALLLLTVLSFAASLVFSHYLPAPHHRVVRYAPQTRNYLAETLGMLLPMVFVVGFWFLMMRQAKTQQTKLLKTKPEFVQPRTIEITPDYLRHQGASGEVKTRWKGIQKIVETATHIFFWVSPNEAHVVPKRAFANVEDATQFAQLATKYWEQAQSK